MASLNFHTFSQRFVSFPPTIRQDIHIFVATFNAKLSTLIKSLSTQMLALSKLLSYMVSVIFIFLSPPPFISHPSALSKGSSKVVSVGLWSVRRIFFDYTAHEVPLPLFGLGYDGACTFRGAPLPHVGKHELQSLHFVRRLHPKFGFGYDWGRRFCELRGYFHWQIVVLLAVASRCY